MKQGYVRLGDICTACGGYTPQPSLLFEDGPIPYFKVSDMNREGNNPVLHHTDLFLKEAKKTFPAGAVVFPKNGGAVYTNKKRILSAPSVVDLNTGVAIPREDLINESYFFYFFSSIDFRKFVKEGTLPVLRIKELCDLPLYLPPLPEQQRIVEFLDTEFAKIDALKANAEKNLQHAKDLFQAALKEELTPKEGWKTKKLGEVCNIFGRIGFRGYTTKDIVSSPEEGAISLSPSNIQDGRMDYSKCTYISWYKYEESPEIMISNGDILLVKTGSSYGKSALVERLPHEATINPQFVVLKEMKVNNKFLAYQIRTKRAKDEFDKFVSGTAIPTFSQAKLSGLHIFIPPLPEQTEIVSRLDAISECCKTLQTNYERTIALCDDMKQALLRKAFNGEL